MGSCEQTANLFEHADCGFYFCLLYPLSYAFSLKVESNLSQNPSFAHTHTETQKHTEMCPIGAEFELQSRAFFIDRVVLFSYCCCDLINHYV